MDVQYGGVMHVRDGDMQMTCDALRTVDPAVISGIDLQDERAVSDVLRCRMRPDNA
jgi:hypothetical protein